MKSEAEIKAAISYLESKLRKKPTGWPDERNHFLCETALIGVLEWVLEEGE